jgi:tellurite resistance protein
MTTEARLNLLARLAQSTPDAPRPAARPSSILSVAAVSYGARPVGDATVPTGFDPVAVALFEAIVEAAYVVANADGVFDAEERRVFEQVVTAACGGAVAPHQIHALVSDLDDQLREDGVDRRIEMIATSVMKKDHAREVLRVAALLAHVSDDVSPVEHEVLRKLADKCEIDVAEVEVALDEAKRALSGSSGAA